MASRNFRDVQALNREVKIIAGQVTTGADGAVSSSTGLGYSATNSAEGVYTITLEDNYTLLLHASANDIDTTVSIDSNWYIDTDSVTSGSMSFNRVVAGTNTDLDNGLFSFVLFLTNSDVQ